MTRQPTVNLGVLPQAFRDAIETDLRSSSPWTSLRDAVTVCTRQLRTYGYYPEKVLVAIKSAVRSAAARLLPEEAAEEIVRAAAQFCISAYFDTPQQSSETVNVPLGVSTPGSIQSRSLSHHH